MSDQNESDELVLAVEKCFMQTPAWIVVGDLFITARGLHYVPLSQFQNTGKLAGILGAIIGGWQGGIAAAMGANQEAGRAIGAAAQARIEQYGLNLQERISADSFAIERTVSIPRGNIASLDVSKDLTGLVCRSRDGKAAEFRFSALNAQDAQTIGRYLQVTPPAMADSSAYGLGIPYPRPVRLLEMLMKDQPIGSETWQGIACNCKYIEILYFLLKHYCPGIGWGECRNVKCLSASGACEGV